MTQPIKFYSTGGSTPTASLSEAVVRGLAPDRGLYMPERIPTLPQDFFDTLPQRTLSENALIAANALFGGDIPETDLKRIIDETLSFDIPLVKVEPDIHALELFHGPTLAFKDVGARFMARLLGYFNPASKNNGKAVNVLVATSGDTGSAVANGFLGVEGVQVFVLYPKGKVSPIQEAQFTTLGRNITAVEVAGTFDDCQSLVKQAFMDSELTSTKKLTSANSINVARFLPQMFYYFHAVAQLMAQGVDPRQTVVCVPSGNFGNIAAGLIAKRMGLPVKRFIAANNANSVFYEYLASGEYRPRPSVQTIANAMDVGDPSNFARILDLYGNSHSAITADISGATYTDSQIAETMADVWSRCGYRLDPHGAVGCRALREGLQPGETGIFLETAHPAKFKETVERVCGDIVEIPRRLADFMRGEKDVICIATGYSGFKNLLLARG